MESKCQWLIRSKKWQAVKTLKIIDLITQAYYEVYQGSLDVVVTRGELLTRWHLSKGAQCFWIGLHCDLRENHIAVWKWQTFHYFLIWALGHIAWREKGFWMRKITLAWTGRPGFSKSNTKLCLHWRASEPIFFYSVPHFLNKTWHWGF